MVSCFFLFFPADVPFISPSSAGSNSLTSLLCVWFRHCTEQCQVRYHLIHQVVSTLGANPAGRLKAALHKPSEGRIE